MVEKIYVCVCVFTCVFACAFVCYYFSFHCLKNLVAAARLSSQKISRTKSAKLINIKHLKFKKKKKLYAAHFTVFYFLRSFKAISGKNPSRWRECHKNTFIKMAVTKGKSKGLLHLFYIASKKKKKTTIYFIE